MIQTRYDGMTIMLRGLKTLTLCIVLLGTSALAEADPHAGHHPETAPATHPAASNVNAAEADPACPMMSMHANSGGMAFKMPAPANPEGKMHDGNMMMDHMKSDGMMNNCMKPESRPSGNDVTPPVSPPK